MRRCIVNAHTDWWRRRTWREQPRPLVPDQPERADMTAVHAARDVVLRALARLTARERAVIALRFYFDLTEFQIAHELGIAPDAVTPEVLGGTVRLVAGPGDSFAIQLDGSHGVTSYAMRVSPVMWRDKYGNWFEGTHPACLRPGSHGQHITFGVVKLNPAREAVPGGPAVVWVECARSPVPRYPIVTPKASGPP